jgi:ankyrin repeat protein
VAEDDVAGFRRVVERHAGVKARINEPVAAFDSPLITTVRSRAMLDALGAAGADINARSQWWAGGFGLLDNAQPDLAEHAIKCGARVTIHSAARLGLMEKLRELVTEEPALVRERGGDGQTPLHFAGTVEVAKFLLEHGADIDARDVDHESTPAQYMVGGRREVCRYLVQNGCKTDLLMAAALGDAGLVRRHLDGDPGCINLRVNDEYFPRENPKSGGTIYQWTLGWHLTAHDVARQFHHDDIFRLLMARSPDAVKLLAACQAGDEATVKALFAKHPNLAAGLTDSQRCAAVYAARNNQLPAVCLLLAAGLPSAAHGPDRVTALHWAAFHGNAGMTRAILRHQPPLELADANFQATPLRWAIYGSEHGWHRRTGNYPATVEALLKAGAQPPEKIGGTEAVQAAIHSVLATRR